MAMKGKQTTLRLGGVVLAVLLSIPVAGARTAATATPVPFPKAPASLPTEAEIQAKLTNLQGFMTRVDRVIGRVHAATEDYRRYVGRVKEMLASCEVESDTSGFENTPFAELVADGGRQCRGWVADFDQQARAYAARLDEAVAFQKLVQRVGARVQVQIDRHRIALHAKRLKRAVDQGMGELDKARKGFKPWMN